MLYPRETKDGKLVTEDQMVDVREHMTQNYRLMFFTGVISGDTESHNLLMAMDSLNHKPIKIVITSPGGDLDSAFLFYDTMRMIKSPIITVGRYCASAAALILAAGSKRYLFPHAKVMLHLPSGQAMGDARDWEIQHQEMKKYKNKLADAFCECGVKRSREQVLADMDRDFWLEPEQAVEYGLADKVLEPTDLRQMMKAG